MERDFKGVWIPKEIWFDKQISIVEKCLLVEIHSLDNEEGCYASNNYFAEFFDLTDTRISQMISKLIDLGYVKKESFDGRKRILRSNISISLNSDLKKTKVSPEVKLKPHNITNNQSNKTKYPISFQVPMDWPDTEFILKFGEFEKIRKAKKKPVTQEAIKLLVDDLIKFSGGDWKVAKEIMNRTIKRGYGEFYPLDEIKKSSPTDNDKYAPDKY